VGKTGVFKLPIFFEARKAKPAKEKRGKEEPKEKEKKVIGRFLSTPGRADLIGGVEKKKEIFRLNHTLASRGKTGKKAGGKGERQEKKGVATSPPFEKEKKGFSGARQKNEVPLSTFSQE